MIKNQFPLLSVWLLLLKIDPSLSSEVSFWLLKTSWRKLIPCEAVAHPEWNKILLPPSDRSPSSHEETCGGAEMEGLDLSKVPPSCRKLQTAAGAVHVAPPTPIPAPTREPTSSSGLHSVISDQMGRGPFTLIYYRLWHTCCKKGKHWVECLSLFSSIAAFGAFSGFIQVVRKKIEESVAD